MTAILKEDPPELSPMSRGIDPAGVGAHARHCLEKDPEQRFQSARDLAFNLEALSQYSGSSAERIAKPTAARRLRRFQIPIVVVLMAMAGALGYVLGHKSKPSSEVTYHQLTFRKGTVLSARFAPDNRTVIYSAAWGGSDPELFSTRKDSIESHPRSGCVRSICLAFLRKESWQCRSGRKALPDSSGRREPWAAPLPLPVERRLGKCWKMWEWFDWSPRMGPSLLVTRTVENEERIEYPIGKVIYKAASPAWISQPRISRDGKRVAFCKHDTRGDDRGSAVAIMNVDGSDVKSFGDFTSLYGLAWSPKGDEVWFTADPTTTTIARRLMAVSMAGQFRLLAAAPGDLTLHDVSSDGTAVISIDDRERKIFFADPKDNSERELTWLDRAVLVALSADGKQVLYFTRAEEEGVPMEPFSCARLTALPQFDWVTAMPEPFPPIRNGFSSVPPALHRSTG